MATQPLIINDWQQGVSDSPHAGTSLLRNVDIESFPGAVKCAKKPQTYFHAITTRTFTANDGTDICTASGALEANGATFGGAAVYFTTTGTLPAGLSTGTVYFLIYASANTFKVATSYKNAVGTTAGTAINITDTGTGTHTINQLGIGTINWIIKDPRNSYYYMLSSNGRVWFVPGGTTAYLLHNSAIESVAGSLTNASGNGLVLHGFSSTTSKWLIVFRNAKVDIIDVYDNTAIEALSWTNNWQSLNTATGTNNAHQALVGQDNIIYFTDDRYVGSLKENSGGTFAPGTGGTFTYNNQALDLPSGEIAQCLVELNQNLLVGSNVTNKIYPWDRSSDSFNLPIQVPESVIKRLGNAGGTVYILAGSLGNIYETQGSYVRFVKKIPSYVVNNSGTVTASPITWGGLATVNNSIIFGVQGTTSGSSGLYRLYFDGRLIQEATPSTGSANVIGLFADTDFYHMGYAGGADNFSNATRYASLEAIIHSGFYQVATKIEKATYSRLEVVVAKPASNGQVRVSYRSDTSSAFTTIDTFTADAATTTFSSEGIGLTDIDKIQIQVEFDEDLELVEIRLLP